MTVGFGIFLIVVGAIIMYALNVNVAGVEERARSRLPLPLIKRAPARERAAEGDLVRVLEVGADR
jgi:hypothetical protein